jgi:hypothetical protein
MPDMLELDRVTPCMGVGFLADKGLLAVADNRGEDLTDEERAVLRGNADAIHDLFLAKASDLVTSDKMAFLEAVTEDWYQRVAKEAKEHSSDRAPSGLVSWAREAYDAALKLSNGSAVTDSAYRSLVGLLEALSEATLVFVDEMLGNAQPKSHYWSLEEPLK